MLDLLFPIYCLGCGQGKEYLCPSCFNSIPPGSSALLKNLHLFSSAPYNNPLVKKMIFEYKYNFVKELAKPLGSLMAKILRVKAVLVPVPLHARRLRWRGFNQSLLLALEIGQQLSLPVADCLIRVKHTSPQMKIQNALERKKNIQNAFQLKYLPKGKIILIDDVCSTGATLEACAKLLKPLKSEEIWGLVIARG